MSLVKSAPCSRSASSTSSVAPDTGSSGCASPRTDWSSHGRSERITSVTGVARDADALLRCDDRGSASSRTFNRAHATSPDMHSSSSQALRYPETRPAAPTPPTRAAGISKPWSCAIVAATPARPSRCVPGATRCQRSRKRMKSCAADRLDLLTQALLRVAVNAHEQAARAPLLVVDARDRNARESRIPHPRASRGRRRSRWSPSPVIVRESPARHRPAHLEMAAEDRRDHRILFGHGAAEARAAARTSRGSSVASGHSTRDARQAFGRAPERSVPAA